MCPKDFNDCCCKSKETMKASYCEGEEDNTVAFIFLCPGQLEEILEKPVCGATGAHLECIIYELRKHAKELEDEKLLNYFKYCCRYKYRIINLSTTVHYNGSEDRDEPTDSEIKESKNIKRLRQAIKDMELIIVFDKDYSEWFKDHVISNNIDGKKIIYSRHLSPRSINQIDRDVNNLDIEKQSENNLKRRIEVISKDIMNEFNSLSEHNEGRCLSSKLSHFI